MASFWDKLKSFIVGGGGSDGGEPPAPPESELARRVEAIVVRRMTRKEAFEAIEIADEAATDPGDRTIKGIAEASAIVSRLHDEGRFEPLGYARTKLASGNWLYHPKGHDLSKQGVQTKQSAPAPAPAKSAAPAPAP